MRNPDKGHAGHEGQPLRLPPYTGVPPKLTPRPPPRLPMPTHPTAAQPGLPAELVRCPGCGWAVAANMANDAGQCPDCAPASPLAKVEE